MLEVFRGIKHNSQTYVENSQEIIYYLKIIEKCVLSGDSSLPYIVFLQSDLIEFTNNIENKIQLIFKNNIFYCDDSIFENSEEKIIVLENKLNSIINNKLENDNSVCFVEDAIDYYLKGYKVRRYITKEIFELHNEIQFLKRKRIANSNDWEDNWVYNDGSGKKLKYKPEGFSNDWLLSPIESFERNGSIDKTRLWQIKF